MLDKEQARFLYITGGILLLGMITWFIAALLSGCAEQPDYYETLENWREKQSNTQVVELREKLAEANSKLVECQTENEKAGIVFDDLYARIKTLEYEKQQLSIEMAERPATGDIIRLSKAMQEQATQYNELSEKFTTLMNMWQQLKTDYSELTEVFREVVNSSNYTENQTREYLDMIE